MFNIIDNQYWLLLDGYNQLANREKGQDNIPNNAELNEALLSVKELKSKLEYQKQENIKIADWYRNEIAKINKWHEANYKNLPKPITKISRAIEKIKTKKI